MFTFTSIHLWCLLLVSFVRGVDADFGQLVANVTIATSLVLGADGIKAIDPAGTNLLALAVDQASQFSVNTMNTQGMQIPPAEGGVSFTQNATDDGFVVSPHAVTSDGADIYTVSNTTMYALYLYVEEYLEYRYSVTLQSIVDTTYNSQEGTEVLMYASGSDILFRLPNTEIWSPDVVLSNIYTGITYDAKRCGYWLTTTTGKVEHFDASFEKVINETTLSFEEFEFGTTLTGEARSIAAVEDSVFLLDSNGITLWSFDVGSATYVCPPQVAIDTGTPIEIPEEVIPSEYDQKAIDHDYNGNLVILSEGYGTFAVIRTMSTSGTRLSEEIDFTLDLRQRNETSEALLHVQYPRTVAISSDAAYVYISSDSEMTKYTAGGAINESTSEIAYGETYDQTYVSESESQAILFRDSNYLLNVALTVSNEIIFVPEGADTYQSFAYDSYRCSYWFAYYKRVEHMAVDPSNSSQFALLGESFAHGLDYVTGITVVGESVYVLTSAFSDGVFSNEVHEFEILPETSNHCAPSQSPSQNPTQVQAAVFDRIVSIPSEITNGGYQVSCMDQDYGGRLVVLAEQNDPNGGFVVKTISTDGTLLPLAIDLEISNKTGGDHLIVASRISVSSTGQEVYITNSTGETRVYDTTDGSLTPVNMDLQHPTGYVYSDDTFSSQVQRRVVIGKSPSENVVFVEEVDFEPKGMSLPDLYELLAYDPSRCTYWMLLGSNVEHFAYDDTFFSLGESFTLPDGLNPLSLAVVGDSIYVLLEDSTVDTRKIYKYDVVLTEATDSCPPDATHSGSIQIDSSTTLVDDTEVDTINLDHDYNGNVLVMSNNEQGFALRTMSPTGAPISACYFGTELGKVYADAPSDVSNPTAVTTTGEGRVYFTSTTDLYEYDDFGNLKGSFSISLGEEPFSTDRSVMDVTYSYVHNTWLYFGIDRGFFNRDWAYLNSFNEVVQELPRSRSFSSLASDSSRCIVWLVGNSGFEAYDIDSGKPISGEYYGFPSSVGGIMPASAAVVGDTLFVYDGLTDGTVVTFDISGVATNLCPTEPDACEDIRRGERLRMERIRRRSRARRGLLETGTICPKLGAR